MIGPEQKPQLDDGELETDPKALQDYLLLSQVAEDAIERSETIGEEE